MKPLLTIIFLTMLLPSGFSQKGFTLGANFMPVSSNIVVQNTWGNGREYDYVPTFRTSFGLDVGYNLSDRFGIYSGYWLMDLGQDYEDSYSGSDWERSLKFSHNMIPLMAKFYGTKSKVNFLAGAGLMFASMNEAEQEWLRDGAPYEEIIENPITGEDFNLGETDVTDRFNQNDILINFELGARILFSEHLHLDTGLSFGYGLKDINAEDWQIPDGDGEYDPSHNAYVALKVGLAYLFTSKEKAAE